MRILITGASGFVGSHLVDKGLRLGFDIYAGIREHSSRQYLSDNRIKFINTDLNNLQQVEKELMLLSSLGIGFDYIIHNAGVTKANDAEGFMNGNAHLAESFFRIIMKHQPDLPTIIYISSMAAGGPGSSDMQAIKYGDFEKPMTAYGESKKKGEELLRDLSCDHLIFRPTAIYGPREYKMLPLIKLMMKGIEPDIADPRQRLSFIHVEDLTEVIYAAIDKGLKNDTYLVSDGYDYSIQEYRKVIKNYLGLRTIRIRLSPLLLRRLVSILNKLAGIIGKKMHFTPQKVDDITAINWKVDSSKLENAIDYKFKYNLETGLQNSMDWYIMKEWI